MTPLKEVSTCIRLEHSTSPCGLFEIPKKRGIAEETLLQRTASDIPIADLQYPNCRERTSRDLGNQSMHCSCHAAQERWLNEFNSCATCGAYGYNRNGAIRTTFFLKNSFVRWWTARVEAERSARESGIGPVSNTR